MSGRIGEVLHGKWRLDSFIGRGGSADVYAATHRNGKRAAVKILHAQYASSPELMKRFLREGYVANSLNHAGAVSVLDDDRCEDGSAYLVMELLEGSPLSDFGKKKIPLSLGAVLRIADEVLDVLAAAHERGIVHRDIKPGNLFLTNAGQTKVLDFGIARLLEPDGGEPLTLSGTSLGTPAYMAPEQARGRWELVDGRTDLWALGATLIALLTGRKPRKADTANEELLFAMTLPIPPFATFSPTAPPQICALVDRALAYEREQRFANAREMQAAVRAAWSELGPFLATPLDVVTGGDASLSGLRSNTVNMTPQSHGSHGGIRSVATQADPLGGPTSSGGVGATVAPVESSSPSRRALWLVPIVALLCFVGVAVAFQRSKASAQAHAPLSAEIPVEAHSAPVVPAKIEAIPAASAVALASSAPPGSAVAVSAARTIPGASARVATQAPKPSAGPGNAKKPECTDVFSCRNE